MTRKELDEHYKLLDFLHQAQEMQRHIQKKAEKEKGNARLFPALQDSLADIEKSIAHYEKQIAESAPCVVAFIDSVDVQQEKQILRYRYVYGMAWCEVSDVVHKSESACRMVCNRYLKKRGIV